MSKTHWATCRLQPSLLTASCCATSQVMSMLFKFCCMVSIQIFRGLPGFLFELLILQCTACLGSLLSSIRRTCPSHLSLLSFMMRSIFSSFLYALWPSHYRLCLVPWDTYHSSLQLDVRLLAVSFVQLLKATILHHATLWTSITTHTISLWVWCWYAWSSIPISIFQIRLWLCRFLFGSLCRNYCYLSHSCPDSKIPIYLIPYWNWTVYFADCDY